MVTELRGQPFVSLQFHRTPASWLPMTASYHLSLLGRVAVTAGGTPRIPTSPLCWEKHLLLPGYQCKAY